MKSHSFLSTFIRYAFTALVTLYIVYWLADFHINDLPGFTLQEGFMIAGEALVFCAFILAFKDTRKSAFEEFMDGINFNMIPIVPGFNAEEVANSVETLRKYGNKEKKTTKGIPLSEEHKKKISESLKKKNAEKKRMLFNPAVTAKTKKPENYSNLSDHTKEKIEKIKRQNKR